MKKIYTKSRLDDLKKRAEEIKNNPNLRHTPNEKDRLVALEHAKVMQPAQYATLRDE